MAISGKIFLYHMRIPPSYQITPEILELVAKIDANIILFSSINIPPKLKEKIQRISLLKSSLFSARIEGNPLTLENVETSENKQKKREIFNILEAIKFLDKEFPFKKEIDKKLILNLHKITMEGLIPEAGSFRREMGAIFNRSGQAIYVSPPPEKVPRLIDQMIDFIKSDKERFPLITSFITHLIFEKIHPFIDGNGRVGRLLVFSVLKSKGYNFDFFIPFEEYLDEHKEDYYYFLDIGLKRPESYLYFMLKAFHAQTEKIKTSLMNQMIKKETINLPLRREEIYNIINDHRIVSFDFIKRRFLRVPERTLRYDLKKLCEAGLVVKVGETRGCQYKIVN